MVAEFVEANGLAGTHAPSSDEKCRSVFGRGLCALAQGHAGEHRYKTSADDGRTLEFIWGDPPADGGDTQPLSEVASLKLEVQRLTEQLEIERGVARDQRDELVGDKTEVERERDEARKNHQTFERAANYWKKNFNEVGDELLREEARADQLESVAMGAAFDAERERLRAEQAEGDRVELQLRVGSLQQEMEHRENFTKEQLKNIAAVRVNILRGVIALPPEYAEPAREIDGLRKMVEQLEAKLVEANSWRSKLTEYIDKTKIAFGDHRFSGQPTYDTAAELVAALDAPIRLVLTCPSCGKRHIDEGDWATKPHHTHSCQHCGLTWRPAVEDTVGVQFLPGFKNEVPRG